jgi:hypothetical protein
MTLIQFTTAFLVLVTLPFCGLWIYRHQRYWGYAVGPVSWLVHILLKSAWLWITILDDPVRSQAEKAMFNTWSAAIQIHGILVVLTLAVIGVASWKSGKRL